MAKNVFCPECAEWWGAERAKVAPVINPCPAIGCGSDWAWTGLPERYTAVRSLYPDLEMGPPQDYEDVYLECLVWDAFGMMVVRHG